MSAVNIIPSSDGIAIFTDAAVYSPAGVLQDFADKCYLTDNRRIAVAGRGNHGFAEAMRDLISDRDFTFDELRTEGRELIGRAFATVRHALLEAAGKAANDVFLVGWSDAHGGVRAAQWSWNPIQGHVFSIGDAKSLWVAPAVPEEEIRKAIKASTIEGVPRMEAFALAIMKLQRLDKGDPLMGGGEKSSVGGYVLRTDVTRTGITQRVVHRWPEDRIGHVIEPAAEVDPALRPNVASMRTASRAERRRQASVTRRGAA